MGQITCGLRLVARSLNGRLWQCTRCRATAQTRGKFPPDCFAEVIEDSTRAIAEERSRKLWVKAARLAALLRL